MITLYKHQQKLVKNVLKSFSKGNKHVLVQSPTGSGKTIMFSYMAMKSAAKKNKVLIVTDRTELLFQAGGTMEKFNLNPSYIKAGTNYIERGKDVYVAMSQTLRNRVDKKNWRDFIQKNIKLVIIDEAHIQEFNYLFESDGLLDNIHIIGFTATPTRSGKMSQLGLQYQDIISGQAIKKLIKKGYLLNCDIYDCGSPDMSNVKINSAKGDFSESSMFKKYDNPKLYQGLEKNYQKYSPNQKMIVFCCNVEHAIKTTIKLNKIGVSAKFVCSKKTPPKEPKNWTTVTKAIFNDKFRAYKLYNEYYHKHSGERVSIFEKYKNNEFKVLVNVDIATKGFDCPDIEVVALYRATTSLALYLQMIGRGARIHPSKSHFTVFDFGGNKSRFGPYDVERGWTLWHEESKSTGGAPPMKICGENSKLQKIEGAAEVKKGCERLILATYKMCPFCGFKYPEKNAAKEVELALAEIVDEEGVSLKTKAFSDMSFSELHKYREIKKHHMAWLWRMLWIRNKEQSIKSFAAQFGWKSAYTRRAIKHCQSKYK